MNKKGKQEDPKEIGSAIIIVAIVDRELGFGYLHSNEKSYQTDR